MASKKTLNLKNLTALGASTLAELLIELSEDDANIKRRLRLELTAATGGVAVATEVGKRLASLARARSFVDWKKRKAFVKDIDLQRATIVDKVAKTRPDLALDLMWKFMSLAPSVIERVDDSYGDVGDVFRQACLDLGTLARDAAPDPASLADKVFEAVAANDYGEFDDLVPVIFPALTDTGVARLKHRLTEALAKRPANPESYDFRAAAFRRVLQEIADGEGDVDAFIELHDDNARKVPRIAAGISNRLLTQGRAEDALAALKYGAPDGKTRLSDEWDDAWIAALLAVGRREEAQTCRWNHFERRLSAKHLRGYLADLPEFDDVEAEEKALDHALGFPSLLTALNFLIGWPALVQAAKLVVGRPAEIDGNYYYILDPAAKALEGKYPLAATLLRRAMIEDTLNGAKSKRYRHAARHVLECASLKSAIDDHLEFEPHDAFLARLRKRHGRKASFWSHLPPEAMS